MPGGWSGYIHTNRRFPPLFVLPGLLVSVAPFDGSRVQDPHGPSSLAVHPSGDYVLVGTGHCNVRLYDASTSQCFTSAYHSDQHTAPITCVDYAPDGKQYVSGCKGGVVKIWDGISSRVVFSLDNAHAGAPVSSAVFSRNSQYLLTAGMDSVVRLWDLRAGGRVLCKYEGAQSAKLPWRAVFSHDEVGLGRVRSHCALAIPQHHIYIPAMRLHRQPFIFCLIYASNHG